MVLLDTCQDVNLRSMAGVSLPQKTCATSKPVRFSGLGARTPTLQSWLCCWFNTRASPDHFISARNSWHATKTNECMYRELCVVRCETGSSRSREKNEKLNTETKAKPLTFCFHCRPRDSADAWSPKPGAGTPRRRCGPPGGTASSGCASGGCAGSPARWPRAGTPHSTCNQRAEQVSSASGQSPRGTATARLNRGNTRRWWRQDPQIPHTRSRS